ncbi:MAG: hypothetical protein KF819_24705 [Labilithrix sp.]|nr:hypothetical protein [Labilithrix sp.]
MPADGVVQIAFDRYLNPITVNRQSVVIVDAANQPLAADQAPTVTYDPVARTVTLGPPKQPWLTEGQPYKVIFAIPEGDSDVGGLRAIDRATLWAGQPLSYAFFVGPPANRPVDPPVSFCRDVLPIFYAKCNVPTCHGSSDRAAASLVLDTSAGVANTALSRVAQGANTGPLSGAGTPPGVGRPFGVDMPLIEPGNPGSSWLLYKIELAALPANPAADPGYACTNGLLEPKVAQDFAPLAPQAQRGADAIERAILSDFILGREMPFPFASVKGYEDAPLTFEERQKIRIWIQNLKKGEGVPECGGCGIVTPADAGAPREGGVIDGGVIDSGADASDAADQ